MNNQAKVLFFATLRDKAGTREATIEFAPGTRISEIKSMVLELFPGLKSSMETMIIAMNHEFAFDDHVVPDGAEIAFFPPVSGGGRNENQFPTLISIVNEELDINYVIKEISSERTGAACVFTGIVRGITHGDNPHQTDELEYVAYREMAEAKMHQIAKEIHKHWIEVEGIALIQRIGNLFPGELSVIVGCTASHRDSGIFEAAHYGIDRLKEIVPIWKKEIGPGMEVWVEGNYLPKEGE